MAVAEIIDGFVAGWHGTEATVLTREKSRLDWAAVGELDRHVSAWRYHFPSVLRLNGVILICGTRC